ncbi:rod-binding protein [Roseivivax sp. CAU 1761]
MEFGRLPPLTPGDALAARPATPDPAAKAARDFEASFLSQAVDEMLKSTGEGFFGGGQADETWRSFLSNAVADALADTGSTGIAQSVEDAIRAYGQGNRT